MENIQTTTITANGTKTMSLIPGRRYSLLVGGTFGGGTVTPTQTFTGDVIGSCGMTGITAVGMQNFIAGGNSIDFVMAGAGGIYGTIIALSLCPVGV